MTNKLLLAILIMMFSFSGCGKKVEFDKKEWLSDDPVFIPESRYAMAMWLKDNYLFCGKSHDEILDQFGKAAISKSDSTDESKLSYLIKQKDNNFIIGIDLPTDMAYLVIYLKNDIVLKALIKERKSKDAPYEEYVICE